MPRSARRWSVDGVIRYPPSPTPVAVLMLVNANTAVSSTGERKNTTTKSVAGMRNRTPSHLPGVMTRGFRSGRACGT